MSDELLSSKIVVAEEEPRIRSIPSAATSVLGAVGITERGPVGEAVRCSVEDFSRVFGGFTQNADLALAAAGFFENGGKALWVVRTAHYADPADPASVTARRASAPLTAHVPAHGAMVASTAALPLALADGDRLVVSLDGSTDVSVAFSAANVATLAAVTLDEIKAAVEAAIPGVTVEGRSGGFALRTTATGAMASLQVRPATAGAFGLDSQMHSGSDARAAVALRVEGKDPGAYANTIEVEVASAAGLFSLFVIKDGAYRESFRDLSMDPIHPRYVASVVNDPQAGSVLIRVVDERSDELLLPSAQTTELAGGDDGLVGLDDNDFIGSRIAKTGLYALDRALELSLLIVPGRATPAVHNAMVRYCEIDRRGTVFPILDPPERLSATEIVTYVETTAGLLHLSEFGAIYWPHIKVTNPRKSVFGPAAHIVVAPSGVIAGVFARTDGARPGGVYDPPAGIEAGRMFGVVGFETDEVLDESARDLVYPKRINPLTTGPGLPRYIDGSRTLKGNGNFPYVAERRGVIFIERSLKDGLQFARHKNNTEGLRAQVRRTIDSFLLTQMNNGAFRSREPAKAFFVDVSDELNSASAVFAGKLLARVGLATNKPAEFIVLLISQDVRTLEAELAGGARS